MIPKQPLTELSILVVDDNTVFNQTLCRSLARKGISVFSSPSSEDAADLLQNQHIDGAIVDLKMEGASGLSLIPKIKTSNPKCAIVMLTGYASIATAVEAIKLGANNYLTKPANTDEILTALFSETNIDIPERPARTKKTMSVNRLEWEHIQKVLTENNGNISATSRALGMHRRTLQRKLQKHPVKR
ncbi:two-component system response regulator [Gammaproteobacteria bacterium 42_54_T18]|nr:two-component system response regulator [Gammaproteobacteria bacterium 42_54_T18]